MGTWLLRLHHDSKSAIALMVALMAPVLVGCGALAVDATSWSATHEALQVAADAAALTASMSGLSGKAADAVAINAANTATANSFDFSSTDSGEAGTIELAVASNGDGTDSYTVTVTAPLNTYLLRLVPEIFRDGTASARAVALRETKQITTGGGSCILALSATAAQAINVSGGGLIKATNCGVFANSSASSAGSPSTGDAITASGSGRIEGTSVGTVGEIYAAPWSAYVGATTGTGYGVGPGTHSGATALADPLASMGDPPSFPEMPDQPEASPSTDIATTGYQLPWISHMAGASGL